MWNIGRVPNTKKHKFLAIVLLALSAYAGYWTYANVGLAPDGLPKGKVSWEFISAREEASLRYPGAAVFREFGYGQVPEQSLTGLSVAFSGAVMTSSSSQDEIYAWYREQLLALGWKVDPKATFGSIAGELSHQSYSRNGDGLLSREAFKVVIWRPEAIAGTLGMDTPQAVTVFEYRYYIRSLDQIEAAKARGL